LPGTVGIQLASFPSGASQSPSKSKGSESLTWVRVIKGAGLLRLAIVEGLNVSDIRMANVRPRYDVAPSQELLVIRENHKTGERSLDLIK
jgi:hypothetical protein